MQHSIEIVSSCVWFWFSTGCEWEASQTIDFKVASYSCGSKCCRPLETVGRSARGGGWGLTSDPDNRRPLSENVSTALCQRGAAAKAGCLILCSSTGQNDLTLATRKVGWRCHGVDSRECRGMRKTGNEQDLVNAVQTQHCLLSTIVLAARGGRASLDFQHGNQLGSSVKVIQQIKC